MNECWETNVYLVIQVASVQLKMTSNLITVYPYIMLPGQVVTSVCINHNKVKQLHKQNATADGLHC